jgi:hypothetical protein
VTSPQAPDIPRNKPTGLVLFSGTHYSLLASTVADRPGLPDGSAAKATVEQLRATLGPLMANSGTFTVTDNTIRQVVVIAKYPAATNNWVEWSFTLNGDSLVMTQVRGKNGPVQNPLTLRLARAK